MTDGVFRARATRRGYVLTGRGGPSGPPRRDRHVIIGRGGPSGPPRRNRVPRLDITNYRGTQTYMITICCAQHARLINQDRIATMILNSLCQLTNTFKFRVILYCLMPDHIHLLLEGHPDSDLLQFVKYFKQITAFRYKQIFKERLWQRSYFDHVLRKEESLERLADYILHNPVRRGLVSDYRDYPYTGSMCDEMSLFE